MISIKIHQFSVFETRSITLFEEKCGDMQRYITISKPLSFTYGISDPT